MSRIGRAPITIPSNVKVDVAESLITVSGPKGKLEREVSSNMTVVLDDGRLVAPGDDVAVVA